jgi:hypothetical protein
MPVVTLDDKTWSSLTGNRGTKWDDEMKAVREGKIVFVPAGDRKEDSLRITLYEAAKRVGLLISVRSYTHDGVRGFAIKSRA